MMNLFRCCVYVCPLSLFMMNNPTMHCRKWRFFLSSSSWILLLSGAVTLLYWYAKQRHCFFFFFLPSPHNARKFIPLRNHKSNRFLLLCRCFAIVPKKHFLAYKSIERSVIYMYGWRLTEISQASSCDVLLCRCGLPLTHWIAFRLFLCDDTIFHPCSLCLSCFIVHPKDSKTHQVGKFNKEKKQQTCFTLAMEHDILNLGASTHRQLKSPKDGEF